jgi:hypothetical protein
MKSPIVGVGFKVFNYQELSLGHTSVFTQVISDGGILFGLYYFTSLIRYGIQSILTKKIKEVFFLVCYVLLISSTTVTYLPLTVAMIAIFYSEVNSVEPYKHMQHNNTFAKARGQSNHIRKDIFNE